MIVHYDKSKLFDLTRSDKNIFLLGFHSLFSYESLFLGEIYTKWPKAKAEIEFLSKKAVTQECMMIFHSKYGTLILIVYSLFPKIRATAKGANGQIVTIQAEKKDIHLFIFLCINSINIEGVIRVSMSSFASSVMSKQELLSFFAEHKRPFELYY